MSNMDCQMKCETQRERNSYFCKEHKRELNAKTIIRECWTCKDFFK